LKLLVDARKARGLSQQAVADKLKRPQSFVSKYESGERRLDVVELLILAEAIGFDAVQMIRTLSARYPRTWLSSATPRRLTEAVSPA
jgi:transcriptional regulator with XRE-family HTH domain